MDATRAKSATGPPTRSHVPLEWVLGLEELSRRPRRPPDYESENRALVTLAKALADSPGTILQTLADTIHEVFQADSAGMSLLTPHDGGERFYWPVIAGAWKPHAGGAEEALLVPIYVQGKAVGTIWVTAHDDRRRFDAEDLRQLESLGRFAAAAYQAVELRQSDDGRRAALNLMEDAIHARDAVERLNVELRESAEELRRNAETFSSLVDGAPFGVYAVDSQFRMHQANAGARAAFVNVTPLIGRDFGEVVGIVWPEPLASEINDIFRRTLETGEPYVAPSLTAQRHDVDVVESYEWQIHRVTLADGQVGVVCYFFDATRLRQAEAAVRESAQRFRMLADNISQLAWTAEANGSVYWYNQRWYDYTGTTFDEMKGAGWKTVHHPDHLAHVEASLERAVETSEIWEDTFPLRGKDGSYRWFLSRALPIRDADGVVVHWFGTNTDITEQRTLENELRQSAAALAETDRRKDEFLAVLAHELRNPLAPIRNALQVMRLTPDGTHDFDVAKDMIERQVGQMVRLVDDLLDVSRITRGRFELHAEAVDIAPVVQLAIDAVRPEFASKGIELGVALPPQRVVVNADTARVTQVIGNLLNNACKFTDRGGRVSLTVDRDDGEAVIRVRDTGIGMAAGQLSRVFDMFVQVDTSLERSAGGLGIGLTLVKELVERHGGTVRASSAGVGEGSEFEVRLPIAADRVVPAAGAPNGGEPATTAARRVLVVDDNWDSATTMSMLLEHAGNETHMAHDGVAAVEAVASFRPDVVLLDIGMPKMNGYEAARRIREQPWGKDVVLVALTGWGQDEDRRKSREAGFDAHVVKPVDYATLLRVVSGEGWDDR